MRCDLPIGMIGAQLIHAAGESSPGGLAEGTYAFALAAKDEATLESIADRLDREGVEFTRIHEPDEPYCGQLMALGLSPRKRSRIAPILSSLPLLKEAATVNIQG